MLHFIAETDAAALQITVTQFFSAVGVVCAILCAGFGLVIRNLTMIGTVNAQLTGIRQWQLHVDEKLIESKRDDGEFKGQIGEILRMVSSIDTKVQVLAERTRERTEDRADRAQSRADDRADRAESK